MLDSFVGLLDLLKKNSTPDVIESTYLDMVQDKLIGKDSQRLDATNPEVDRSVKMAIIAKMKQEFPSLKKYDDLVNDLSEKYYASYKTREVVETIIREYLNEILGI